MDQEKDLRIAMVKRSKLDLIDELTSQLRGLANKSVFIENIKRHKFNWDLTWAAVDMVEDTQLAINSFRAGGNGRSNQGEEYLKVYGLFQAIFMQQDAVKHIAEGLKLSEVSIWEDANASAVRVIRNKYFGHHKHKNQDKTVTYHGVARMSVGSGVISAWTYPNFSTEDINLQEAIKVNREYIAKVLVQLNKDLISKKEAYVSKFTEAMSEDLQIYAFEKLYSWVYGNTEDRSVMARASINIIEGRIDKFEMDVKARFENYSGFGDIERSVKKGRHALEKVKKLYEANPVGMNGDFDAEIYVDSLDKSFRSLIGVAKDINEEFKLK